MPEALPRGSQHGMTQLDPARKTAVVTGASAGVGKAASLQLLGLGWRVIGVGRDPARCASAEADIAAARPGADFTMLRADLSLLSQTAALAERISAIAPRIDALCNNAGGVSATRQMTGEGLESTLASNHLSPFLLTMRLMPCLAPGARVIAVSSTGHEHCPAINWDDLNFEQDWASGRAYAKPSWATSCSPANWRGGMGRTALSPTPCIPASLRAISSITASRG